MDPSGRFLPFGPGGPAPDYWNSLGLDGRGPPEGSMKRKFGEEEEQRDKAELAKHRPPQSMQFGNPNGFPAGPGNRGEFLAGTSSPFRREMVEPRSGDDPRASKYMRIGGGFENAGFRQGGGDNVGHKHLQVDQAALKKAFLHFAKIINENGAQKKIYVEDGKQGRLNCVACGSSGRSDSTTSLSHSFAVCLFSMLMTSIDWLFWSVYLGD